MGVGWTLYETGFALGREQARVACGQPHLMLPCKKLHQIQVDKSSFHGRHALEEGLTGGSIGWISKRHGKLGPLAYPSPDGQTSC